MTKNTKIDETLNLANEDDLKQALSDLRKNKSDFENEIIEELNSISEDEIDSDKMLALANIETQISMLPAFVNHETEMKRIADQAATWANEMANLAFNLSDKAIADAFNGAVNMKRLEMDARNSTVEKKLKLYEMYIRKTKVEQNISPQEVDNISGDSMTRTEILDEIRKEKLENK